jgi:hypothetical protein
MKFLIFLSFLISVFSDCPWECWKENALGQCQIDHDYYEIECKTDSIKLKVNACAFFDVFSDDYPVLGSSKL